MGVEKDRDFRGLTRPTYHPSPDPDKEITFRALRGGIGPLLHKRDLSMTFNAEPSAGKPDTRTLMTGVSALTLAETGEVEIAGRRYVTAERLASMLSVTVRTLARWNASRIGPPKISIGKTVLFDLAKLPDWLLPRDPSRPQHPSLRTIIMSNFIEHVAVPDPFNPASLRLDPSYGETVGVRKLLTTVPVRKPNRHEFLRVHSDPAYRLSPAAIIELKGENETYLISPSVVHELPNEFAPATLFTAINRQGVLFVWPVKLPGIDVKDNEWYRSAREAAERAISAWTRVTANKSLGAYELRKLCKSQRPVIVI